MFYCKAFTTSKNCIVSSPFVCCYILTTIFLAQILKIVWNILSCKVLCVTFTCFTSQKKLNVNTFTVSICPLVSLSESSVDH